MLNVKEERKEAAQFVRSGQAGRHRTREQLRIAKEECAAQVTALKEKLRKAQEEIRSLIEEVDFERARRIRYEGALVNNRAPSHRWRAQQQIKGVSCQVR